MTNHFQEILDYLDQLDYKPTDSIVGIACACAGSPWRWGGPCYCQLHTMKEQQMHGEAVIGWGYCRNGIYETLEDPPVDRNSLPVGMRGPIKDRYSCG